MYSTGTIALTNGNTTVTGTGTAWVGALRQGWLLMIPGEGPLLVASVQSATSLTLARAYQGTTRSGQVYDAVPTQGELAPFVTQLQALLGVVQGTVDNAGAGKFGDGTVGTPGIRFSADEDTGFRRTAANTMAAVAGGADRLTISPTGVLLGQSALTGSDDYNALADMARFMGQVSGTTPPANAPAVAGLSGFQSFASAARGAQMLIQSQGAPVGGNRAFIRGKDTTWAAWSELVHKNNLLGTVSQASGVPTGAVIEKGSNANGEYIRFANGWQICWKVEVINASVAATTYSEVTWTFPAAFAAGPMVMPNARSFNDASGRQNAARYLSGVGGFNSGVTGVIGVWNNHASAVTARVDGLATGYWF